LDQGGTAARRRWPGVSAGLRPWEAPAGARRATPHDRQVNAAHTRHAGQCAPSRLASLLIVQLAVPAFA